MADAPDLSAGLFSAASHFAQSALRARSREDVLVYSVHLGTALELLLKSYLASLHPALIVKEKDFDALLHATGHGSKAKTSVEAMRTIPGLDALDRVGRLLPNVGNLKNQLRPIAEARNGIVHGGILPPYEFDDLLVPFLQAADELAGEIEGVTRQALWGEFIEMIDARLSASADAAQLRVAELVASARVRVRNRYAEVEPPILKLLIEQIEGLYQVKKYAQHLIPCPACSHLALASGEYIVDWEADYEVVAGERVPLSVTPVVYLAPRELACQVCGLRLSGADEMKAAQVPPEIVIDDVDPDDFRGESPWDGWFPEPATSSPPPPP